MACGATMRQASPGDTPKNRARSRCRRVTRARPHVHTAAPLIRLVIKPTTTFWMTADNRALHNAPTGTKNSMTDKGPGGLTT